jgi:hypothetical protein
VVRLQLAADEREEVRDIWPCLRGLGSGCARRLRVPQPACGILGFGLASEAGFAEQKIERTFIRETWGPY